MPRDAVGELKVRLLAIDVLRTMKEARRLRELAEMTGLQPAVLSRYINGIVLPKLERARWIVEKFARSELVRTLEALCRRQEERFLVTQDALVKPWILRLVAYEAARRFGGESVETVLTAAVDGVPLALKVAEEFGCGYCYAKERKEIHNAGHYEAMRHSFSGPVISTLYVPKPFLRKWSRVLIVDDVVRTGATALALLELVEEAKATPVGVFAMFCSREGEDKIRGRGVKVEYILEA